MIGSEALLAANTGFYAAFHDGDLAAMQRIWGHGEGIACLHPGWPVQIGRDAVLDSWQRIFASGAPPNVTCLDPHAWPDSDGGMVICYERVAGQLLAATNLFRLEAGTLVLHHHHSGPCANPPGNRLEVTRH